jgi:rubrerythrin
MSKNPTSRVGGAAWSVDDVPYDRIDHALIRDETELFNIICAASFIEITSDLYTQNLLEFYRGDAEIEDWLANYWEREEVQHGAALKRYVQEVWPEFDWDRAYRGFYDEYKGLAVMEGLAENRALEMVARCVVETGTSSFYRTLSDAAPEPILKLIMSNISDDEVRHYKHFYQYFLRYREQDRPSRFAVLRTLWHRGAGVKAEDAYVASKHVFLTANPGAEYTEAEYDKFRASFRRIGRNSFPYVMACKMILKPLGLSAPLGRVAQPALEYTTRFLFSR